MLSLIDVHFIHLLCGRLSVNVGVTLV